MGLFKKKEIARVKFLGVRTAEETKIMATYNSTVYCFLIEYADGSRAVREFGGDDKALPEVLSFIDMD